MSEAEQEIEIGCLKAEIHEMANEITRNLQMAAWLLKSRRLIRGGSFPPGVPR